ncbi:adhesion G protein-coupled receptor L4-like [Actinia tenebrosa]|uniref:Adhesion G protein-coupled receptor L4-like n=1 Tax=Actinia tenebrosa TaxID=6105 RepID=A0A6P8I6W9_ACTTE|nr:adhesion G protein-coupled receptor L4-like [Actinia tenebrosa]
MFLSILSFLFILALVSESQAAGCRTLEFRATVSGKALTNHTIRTIQPIRDAQTCRTKCYMEPLCFAVNFCHNDGSETVCELLNNTSTIVHDKDLVNKKECTIYLSKSSCSSSPCPSNASCHGDFLRASVLYKCICPSGFTGKFCESDIDECAPNTSYCHKDATCNNSIGSYSCKCKGGYHGNGKTCQDIDECESNTHNCDAKALCNNTRGGFTCKCKPGLLGNGTFCRYPENCEDIRVNHPYPKDGFHNLKTAEGSVVERLCVFSDSYECGSGFWVLALKLNGQKTGNGYTSPLWTSDSAINQSLYKTTFEDDSIEIKLPAFWEHPVKKVCLGMKYLNVLKWVSATVNASSLRSLFESEKEIPTNSSRAKWTSLLSGAKLQRNCNKQGFNMKCGGFSTRIGYLANGENECKTCDSGIGFGILSWGCRHKYWGKYISPSSCYILVQ